MGKSAFLNDYNNILAWIEAEKKKSSAEQTNATYMHWLKSMEDLLKGITSLNTEDKNAVEFEELAESKDEKRIAQFQELQNKYMEVYNAGKRYEEEMGNKKEKLSAEFKICFSYVQHDKDAIYFLKKKENPIFNRSEKLKEAFPTVYPQEIPSNEIENLVQAMKKADDNWHINSSEFKKMRNALYALGEFKKQIAQNGTNSLDDNQKKQLQKHLSELQNYTSEYMSKKGLGKQSSKLGKERMDLASQINAYLVDLRHKAIDKYEDLEKSETIRIQEEELKERIEARQKEIEKLATKTKYPRTYFYALQFDKINDLNIDTIPVTKLREDNRMLKELLENNASPTRINIVKNSMLELVNNLKENGVLSNMHQDFFDAVSQLAEDKKELDVEYKETNLADQMKFVRARFQTNLPIIEAIEKQIQAQANLPQDLKTFSKEYRSFLEDTSSEKSTPELMKFRLDLFNHRIDQLNIKYEDIKFDDAYMPKYSFNGQQLKLCFDKLRTEMKELGGLSTIKESISTIRNKIDKKQLAQEPLKKYFNELSNLSTINPEVNLRWSNIREENNSPKPDYGKIAVYFGKIANSMGDTEQASIEALKKAKKIEETEARKLWNDIRNDFRWREDFFADEETIKKAQINVHIDDVNRKVKGMQKSALRGDEAKIYISLGTALSKIIASSEQRGDIGDQISDLEESWNTFGDQIKSRSSRNNQMMNRLQKSVESALAHDDIGKKFKEDLTNLLGDIKKESKKVAEEIRRKEFVEQREKEIEKLKENTKCPRTYYLTLQIDKINKLETNSIYVERLKNQNRILKKLVESNKDTTLIRLARTQMVNTLAELKTEGIFNGMDEKILDAIEEAIRTRGTAVPMELTAGSKKVKFTDTMELVKECLEASRPLVERLEDSVLPKDIKSLVEDYKSIYNEKSPEKLTPQYMEFKLKNMQKYSEVSTDKNQENIDRSPEVDNCYSKLCSQVSDLQSFIKSYITYDRKITELDKKQFVDEYLEKYKKELDAFAKINPKINDTLENIKGLQKEKNYPYAIVSVHLENLKKEVANDKNIEQCLKDLNGGNRFAGNGIRTIHSYKEELKEGEEKTVYSHLVWELDFCSGYIANEKERKAGVNELERQSKVRDINAKADVVKAQIGDKKGPMENFYSVFTDMLIKMCDPSVNSSLSQLKKPWEKYGELLKNQETVYMNFLQDLEQKVENVSKDIHNSKTVPKELQNDVKKFKETINEIVQKKQAENDRESLSYTYNEQRLELRAFTEAVKKDGKLKDILKESSYIKLYEALEDRKESPEIISAMQGFKNTLIHKSGAMQKARGLKNIMLRDIAYGTALYSDSKEMNIDKAIDENLGKVTTKNLDLNHIKEDMKAYQYKLKLLKSMAHSVDIQELMDRKLAGYVQSANENKIAEQDFLQFDLKDVATAGFVGKINRGNPEKSEGQLDFTQGKLDFVQELLTNLQYPEHSKMLTKMVNKESSDLHDTMETYKLIEKAKLSEKFLEDINAFKGESRLDYLGRTMNRMQQMLKDMDTYIEKHLENNKDVYVFGEINNIYDQWMETNKENEKYFEKAKEKIRDEEARRIAEEKEQRGLEEERAKKEEKARKAKEEELRKEAEEKTRQEELKRKEKEEELRKAKEEEQRKVKEEELRKAKEEEQKALEKAKEELRKERGIYQEKVEIFQEECKKIKERNQYMPNEEALNKFEKSWYATEVLGVPKDSLLEKDEYKDIYLGEVNRKSNGIFTITAYDGDPKKYEFPEHILTLASIAAFKGYNRSFQGRAMGEDALKDIIYGNARTPKEFNLFYKDAVYELLGVPKDNEKRIKNSDELYDAGPFISLNWKAKASEMEKESLKTLKEMFLNTENLASKEAIYIGEILDANRKKLKLTEEETKLMDNMIMVQKVVKKSNPVNWSIPTKLEKGELCYIAHGSQDYKNLGMGQFVARCVKQLKNMKNPAYRKKIVSSKVFADTFKKMHDYLMENRPDYLDSKKYPDTLERNKKMVTTLFATNYVEKMKEAEKQKNVEAKTPQQKTPEQKSVGPII